MLHKLLKDSFIYILSLVFARGISLFTLPLATAYITPREYGILDYVVMFISLVGATVGLEIQQGLGRYMPEADMEEKKSLISSSLWATILIYIIFIGVLFLFFIPLNVILTTEAERYQDVILLVICMLLIMRLDYLFKTILRFDLRSKEYAILNFLYAVIFAGTLYIFLANYQLGLFGYFLSLFCASIISLILSAFLNRKYLVFQFSKKHFSKIISYSSPLIFATLIIILSNYLDRIFIRKYLTLEDLGHYAIAMRFASVGGLLILGVQNSLLPIIYKEYRNDETKEKLDLFFRLFVLLGLILILSATFFAKEALIVMTTPSYYEAYLIVPILTMATLLGGMYIFAVGIYIHKKTTYFLYVGIFSLVCNAALNVAFIQYWGIKGAALATLITSFVTFISFMKLSHQLYPVDYPKVRIFSAVLLTVLLIALYTFKFMNFGNEIQFSTIFLKILVIIFISVALIGTLFTRKEIQDISNYR